MDVEAAADLFEKARVRAAAELRRGDPLWHIWIGLLQAATHSYCYTPLERRAESFMEEVFAVQGRELGPTNPETAESLAMLAGILNRSGRAAEAETRIRESVRVMGSVFKTDNPLAAFAEEMLGENLMSQGRFEEAEPILLKPTRSCCPRSTGPTPAPWTRSGAWRRSTTRGASRTSGSVSLGARTALRPVPGADALSVLRQLFVADAAALRTALDRLQQMQQERDRKDPVDVGESLAPLLEGARLWDPADPMTALLAGCSCSGAARSRDVCSTVTASACARRRLDLLARGAERVPPVELADALALHARFTLAAAIASTRSRSHAKPGSSCASDTKGRQRVRDAWMWRS
jgi:hypothetical protein